MKQIKLILTAIAVSTMVNFALAHEPHLHVSSKWKECSIQLDPSLTQKAWHQFTREAGLVTYFRPLTDAQPMGAGRFEVAVLQWNTGIDETQDAWNNTFVHPNEEHWLVGGSDLPFPGLMLRAGISRKIDGALYWSKRPGANYGVAGAQFQYSLINDTTKNWAVSTRANFSSLYGPEDVNLAVCGFDVLASKKIAVYSNWISISPYAGVSVYGSYGHEKSEVVDLQDEWVSGAQGMVGTVAQISVVRLGAEYNFAKVNTYSFKLGVSFKL